MKSASDVLRERDATRTELIQSMERHGKHLEGENKRLRLALHGYKKNPDECDSEAFGACVSHVAYTELTEQIAKAGWTWNDDAEAWQPPATSGGTDAAASTGRIAPESLASAVASAVAVPAVEDERARFEAWCAQNMVDGWDPATDPVTTADGGYRNGIVQMFWAVWQARAALSAPAGEARAPEVAERALFESRLVPVRNLARAADGSYENAYVRDMWTAYQFGIEQAGPATPAPTALTERADGWLRANNHLHESGRMAVAVTCGENFLSEAADIIRALLDQAPGAQARAHEDTKRLDWLDGQRQNNVQDGLQPELLSCYWQIEAQSYDLRSAIDAAIAAQAHTEKPAP